YIILIVIVIGGGIYVGLRFLKPANASSNNQSADASGQNNSGPGGRFGGGGRGNFKPLTGTIASISGLTIVMTASDGSTKNIVTTSDTRISEMDNGTRQTLSISDLKTGETINVMAQDTTVNPITPQMIIIGTFTPPAESSGGYQGGGNGGGWNGGSQNNSGSMVN
ncbi:MAG: hypothetical protein WCP91_03210, partial [Candidatus Berkelbacteria bacterium]